MAANGVRRCAHQVSSMRHTCCAPCSSWAARMGCACSAWHTMRRQLVQLRPSAQARPPSRVRQTGVAGCWGCWGSNMLHPAHLLACAAAAPQKRTNSDIGACSLSRDEGYKCARALPVSRSTTHRQRKLHERGWAACMRRARGGQHQYACRAVPLQQQGVYPWPCLAAPSPRAAKTASFREYTKYGPTPPSLAVPRVALTWMQASWDERAGRGTDR